MFVLRAHDKPNLVLINCVRHRFPSWDMSSIQAKQWLVIPIMFVSLLQKWVPSFQKVAIVVYEAPGWVRLVIIPLLMYIVYSCTMNVSQ